ncbi:putative LRR receptor-like serine/threonine-protein kinase At1g56140 [Tasmannia lanceolata]|uniref:putative LRR receptor-like serine/threonine-protein kinase At1g56140 n=1 Tax=Tasmannia lanceolata TaxID=3420 RepID=UPI0040633AAF
MALNSIFQHWGVSAFRTWNISGEICSGSAVDDTRIEDQSKPALKCDCSFDNGNLCRITQLWVNELDAVGVIPEQLGKLTELINLNLGQNYLTGPLPAFIGNLTKMRYMSFGANALSGTIPKELGNLQNLLSLAFNENNFSGSLPDELGNLTNLKEFYCFSSGVSGQIPSTFADLRKLQTLWASDNKFTGNIPDFIGNWNITSLRLQGNSFESPIPSSFSKLIAMTDLQVSDISNGSSSLDFIKDMKALSVLILRNNMIYGSIPSNIGEYRHLQFLNLVANNFVIDSSNSSTFPGLNCLQRNFPCNRGSPRYSSISINCGGQEKTSSSGIVFERDNASLGAASYYVTDANNWAVSNVGLFFRNTKASDTVSSPSQSFNTLDPELFQSARLSLGSLRYYGLGLENGNYTVNLQFAETSFENSQIWQSLGRRIFDIYIQGGLTQKDFNIRTEAGGNFMAVQKEFKAQVTENFLEIHLFWAGKGTCCIPNEVTYGPSISAVSITPDFKPSVSNPPPTTTSTKNRATTSTKNRTILVVGIAVVIGVVSFISVLAFFISRRRINSMAINEDEGNTNFTK